MLFLGCVVSVFGLFLWFVFFLFCLVSCLCGLPAAMGQLNGLRKGPHLLSFAAFSSDGFACFSQFIFGKYKLVERPGESHEGVGRKKNMCHALHRPSMQNKQEPNQTTKTRWPPEVREATKHLAEKSLCWTRKSHIGTLLSRDVNLHYCRQIEVDAQTDGLAADRQTGNRHTERQE